MNIDDKRTWELQDPRSDTDLIDPGPRPNASVPKQQEAANREALERSKPKPIKK